MVVRSLQMIGMVVRSLQIEGILAAGRDRPWAGPDSMAGGTQLTVDQAAWARW